MIGPRHCDARTRKTQRLRLEVLEGRDLPAGVSTAHALLQGMTSHGVVRSAEVRTDQPVAGPTQSVAGPIRSMAGPVQLATANPVIKTKFVKAGDWVRRSRSDTAAAGSSAGTVRSRRWTACTLRRCPSVRRRAPWSRECRSWCRGTRSSPIPKPGRDRDPRATDPNGPLPSS
jgi:hypothetical protein